MSLQCRGSFYASSGGGGGGSGASDIRIDMKSVIEVVVLIQKEVGEMVMVWF